MPFYTRHPFDTLLLSDPFFTSFFSPSLHNRAAGSLTERGEGRDDRGAIRAFSPNFDVHETPKEYVLEGELPGLDKSNLSIEFTDTNTLVIRGKIERSYTAGAPPERLLQGTKQKQAITEGQEGAGVEQQAETEEEPVKYWVSERTVGSFQRSFSFPGETDQDNVKASYEDGILKIVIPKKEKRSARRIDIH
ncbi:hsp20-like protein [Tirmania nivea]|nr:hsp20-like protein [Tirmania nivea]